MRVIRLKGDLLAAEASANTHKAKVHADGALTRVPEGIANGDPGATQVEQGSELHVEALEAMRADVVDVEHLAPRIRSAGHQEQESQAAHDIHPAKNTPRVEGRD